MAARARWSCLLIALAMFAASSSSRAADSPQGAAVDGKWVVCHSPHFEVYSHESEADARQIAQDLELLRGAFIERFHVVERARQDVTVFAFKRKADFLTYSAPSLAGRSDSLQGFYCRGRDRATISLAPHDFGGDTSERTTVVFHEYVHHLFRTTQMESPLWFEEGMADLLAGTRVVGDQMEIGRPLDSRVLSLQHQRLLPLSTLFSADHNSAAYQTKEHVGLFYAESWGLLHYLYFGRSKIPRDGVDHFLTVAGDRALAAKVDLQAATKKFLGVDFPTLERQLSDYMVNGSYRWGAQPLPAMPAATAYIITPVPVDEIRARLAELSLRVRGSGWGKFTLLTAAEKNPSDPRPFEALGAAALEEGDDQGAKERWEQAVSAGSRNNAIFRELALMEGSFWLHDFDYYFRLPADTATRLRSRLLQSIAYEPEQNAPYEMLAWVEASTDAPKIANIKLVQEHFNTLQHPQRTLLALALVRIRLGQVADAQGMLDQLSTFPPDNWTIDACAAVFTAIKYRPENMPVNSRTRFEKLMQAASSTHPLRLPSVELPPNL